MHWYTVHKISNLPPLCFKPLWSRIRTRFPAFLVHVCVSPQPIGLSHHCVCCVSLCVCVFVCVCVCVITAHKRHVHQTHHLPWVLVAKRHWCSSFSSCFQQLAVALTVDRLTQMTGIAGSDVGFFKVDTLIFLLSKLPKAPDFLLVFWWDSVLLWVKVSYSWCTRGSVLFLQLLPDKRSVHSSLTMTALRPSKHLVEKEITAPLKEYTELSGDLSANRDQQ